MNNSENGGAAVRVEKVAEAEFPCGWGEFRIHGFRGLGGAVPQEIVALTVGDLTAGGPTPLVRVHSQCLTGEVFHSSRCDCRQQLSMALEKIASEGRGVLLYDPQEGRGIGLLNKLKAYQLQDEGADTVEANEQLGFKPDLRDYRWAVAVLKQLGLTRVRFLSNNPEKVQALEAGGIVVEERVPCEVEAGERVARYLRTKKEKMGHVLGGL